MPHVLQNESAKRIHLYIIFIFIIQLINDSIQITGLRGDPEEKLAAEWIKWAPKVITYAKSERSAPIQKQLRMLDGNEEAADG